MEENLIQSWKPEVELSDTFTAAVGEHYIVAVTYLILDNPIHQHPIVTLYKVLASGEGSACSQAHYQHDKACDGVMNQVVLHLSAVKL